MSSPAPNDPTWPWPGAPLDVPGGRLRVYDAGPRDAPTMLFVHGTPTWSYEWRHLIADLSSDHRCVAIDHLGFGYSDRPADADYRPEAHAARLTAAVEALDLRDLTLVVHDFGGPIGLPLALDPGRVSRIVVMNSWMWSFDDDPSMTWRARVAGSAFGRWLYRWVNFSLRVLLPSAWGDRRTLTPAVHARYLDRFTARDDRVRVLWALARALLGSRDHYQRLWDRRDAIVDRLALVVWGRADSAFGPDQLARWRRAAPDAAVVELETAGHWPHEEQPAAVIRALRGLTERPRPARAAAGAATGSPPALPAPTP